MIEYEDLNRVMVRPPPLTEAEQEEDSERGEVLLRGTVYYTIPYCTILY